MGDALAPLARVSYFRNVAGVECLLCAPPHSTEQESKEREQSMIRSAVGKVMWVGRATVFLVGLAVILALVFGVAATAFGANGGNFILGQNNSASLLTRLTGNVNGAAMQVVNNNADANDTALKLSVEQGEAPMRVNSATKVARLNADRLDGKDFGAFNAVELFDQRRGPLPLESTFTSEGGTLIFFSSGSGFRDSDNTRFAGAIAMNLHLDGIYTRQQSITINAQDHREPFVGEVAVFTGLPAGEHTVRLSAAYGSVCNTDSETFTAFCTSTSTNDRFSVTVLEIPD